MTDRETSTHQNAAEFAWQDDDVFGRIASRYDTLCDVFSLGLHRLWKRRVARCIAREDWNTLLDGATGTGDIILRLLPATSAQGRTIIASDISPRMLAIAAQRLRPSTAVSLRQLDMERMPSIANGSVDAYSISLGLKICDRQLAMQEAFRVLRPGGRLIVLEASNIRWRWLHRAYLAYMGVCMPLLGWLATGGDASAYRYLLQGVRDFPGAEALARELAGHGYVDVSFERLSLGIVAIHTARKPAERADGVGRAGEPGEMAVAPRGRPLDVPSGLGPGRSVRIDPHDQCEPEPCLDRPPRLPHLWKAHRPHAG
ncbi:ubiquinone/menaquinone biosynthesis methyltransferase [Lysobacter sp. A3-1-A15]|uniref:ubiquinone/menaquinone biosynthesis methyltransferase n=1 Tax=Novilysobacter viscosus TaxID=3098602 RepID=UPI002EDB0668